MRADEEPGSRPSERSGRSFDSSARAPVAAQARGIAVDIAPVFLYTITNN
jgi:hypothetical protein